MGLISNQNLTPHLKRLKAPASEQCVEQFLGAKEKGGVWVGLNSDFIHSAFNACRSDRDKGYDEKREEEAGVVQIKGRAESS